MTMLTQDWRDKKEYYRKFESGLFTSSEPAAVMHAVSPFTAKKRL